MATKRRLLILVAIVLIAICLLACGGVGTLSNREILDWVAQQTPTLVP